MNFTFYLDGMTWFSTRGTKFCKMPIITVAQGRNLRDWMVCPSIYIYICQTCLNILEKSTANGSRMKEYSDL